VKRLCVIGSLNTDLVAVVERFPGDGESLLGKHFSTFPGGKGANQAVAAARLGADVAMVGMVGDDSFGNAYREVLAGEHVYTELLGTARKEPTGTAIIQIDARGENRIIYVPGANSAVDVAYIDALFERLSDYDIFLLQLEIPMATVTHACRRLHGMGKIVMLDPAPAVPLDAALLESIDILTPNEHELSLVAGVAGARPEKIVETARQIIASGAHRIVVKCGAAGSQLVDEENAVHVAPFRVDAVDTTAAGDSFNGALAFALAQGRSLVDAMEIANAAGALATTALGAQSAMPDGAAVDRLMRAAGRGAPDV
jgi:ribokinase